MPTKSRGRNWAHPEGMPLDQVDVGAVYSGVVTNVNMYGVFVDFGAVKDGLLVVDRQHRRSFRRGLEMRNMTVITVDPDSEKVTLQPDPDHLPEPAPRPAQRARSARLPAARRAGSRNRSSSLTRRMSTRARSASVKGSRRSSGTSKRWDHMEAGAIPLEEIQPGDVYQGRVTNVSVFGVFVDIGAVRDARLNVTAQIGRRFRINDIVEECTVEVVDIKSGRMSASLPNPEEAVRDLPPKEPKPKAKSKGKAKARAKSKPEPDTQANAPVERAEEDDVIPMEQLEVGSSCNGFVSRKTNVAVFVNIGCGKDAYLRVPKKLFPQFRKGDEIFGMIIDSVDLEKGQITVYLEDPELSVDSGEVEQVAAVSKPKPKLNLEPKAKPKAAAVEHPGGMPNNRFRTNTLANGMVTAIGREGVFVDIGATMDGLLKLPRAIAKQFQVEDEVKGMVVDGLDQGTGRVLLSLDDPELEQDDMALGLQQEQAAGGKTRAKASPDLEQPVSKPKGKQKAKPKATSSRDWNHASVYRLEDLEAGTAVTGVVTNTGQQGVFVDVGAERDGKLIVERKSWRNYRSGDEVTGLVIDQLDPLNGELWLRFMDEYEEESLTEGEAPLRGRPKDSKAPAPAAAQPPAARNKAKAPAPRQAAAERLPPTAAPPTRNAAAQGPKQRQGAS